MDQGGLPPPPHIDNFGNICIHLLVLEIVVFMSTFTKPPGQIQKLEHYHGICGIAKEWFVPRGPTHIFY